MTRRGLAGILALALAARVAVLPYTLPCYDWGRRYPDTREYEAAADGFLAGSGLATGPGEQARRAPLYPLLLAPFRAALGSGRASALAVILLQCLLGAAACAAAADLGARLFGRPAGCLAGIAASLHPELVLYPSLLLSETTAIALTTTALWLAARARAEGGWGAAASAGACAGLAALARASLLPVGVLLAGWIALAAAPPGGGRALRLAALCIAGAAVAVLPWTLRNAVRLGAFVPVTTTAGWDLYEQNCPEASAEPRRDEIRWPPDVWAMDEVAQDRFLRARAFAWARANPRRFTELTWKRIRRFWNPFPNEPGHRVPWVMAAAGAANLPLFVLALASALGVARRRPLDWMLPAIPILLLAAVHAIFMGSVRFRAPGLPGLCVLAAAAVSARRP